MRLQVILETTEEDRALIALSSAIHSLVTAQDLDDPALTHLGSIGDLVQIPTVGLEKVKIDLEGGDQFMRHAMEDNPDTDWHGKEIHAFWDEPTRTIVLNKDLVRTPRMITTITHELRHALDELKSGSYPGGAARYFTPKKKEHRIDDPYSTVQYRAKPAEINARFVEILHILSKRVPRAYQNLEPSEIKPQLSTDFKNLLTKYEIADLFPEKTKSPDYKRLVKRAYDFMDKELSNLELQPTATKHATGNW